jgi:hypothetical protein
MVFNKFNELLSALCRSYDKQLTVIQTPAPNENQQKFEQHPFQQDEKKCRSDESKNKFSAIEVSVKKENQRRDNETCEKMDTKNPVSKVDKADLPN